uniref:Peptidase M14 domain-containing protein n=1 Tax=Melopsittacus undulatus TaxID=13146 RepID=A0A8V5GBS9_MELUD
MKLGLIFSALFGVSLCLETYVGHQVLRIKPKNEEEIKKLQHLETMGHLELDFWKNPTAPSFPADVRIPAKRVPLVKAFLESHGFEYSVLIKDLQVVLDKEKQDMAQSLQKDRSTATFNYGTYHSLDSIYAELDHLASAFNNIVRKIQIGESYEKRPLFVLKFSTGGRKRPAIWLDAGIHSREWVTQASAMWIAKQIASEYGNDPSTTSLLNKMDIFLLPVANPDGYVFTHTTNRMWRKTRSRNKGSLCVGVDPNRNWDAGFGGPGASNNPCSDSYRGPRANSEVEVKSIVDFIRNHGNIQAFLTLHSYSQLLMYPYGYKCTQAADYDELVRHSDVVSAPLFCPASFPLSNIAERYQAELYDPHQQPATRGNKNLVQCNAFEREILVISKHVASPPILSPLCSSMFPSLSFNHRIIE